MSGEPIQTIQKTKHAATRSGTSQHWGQAGPNDLRQGVREGSK